METLEGLITRFVIVDPILGPIFWVLVGTLWSPIAALICGIAARRRGLPALKYAAMGAGYSIMFFFPSVYLTLRMFDRSVPRRVAIIGYILHYAIWFGFISLIYISLVFETFKTVFLTRLHDGSLTHFQICYALEWRILAFVATVAFTLFVYYLWGKSLRDMLRMRGNGHQLGGEDAVVDKRYVRPFKIAFASALGTALAFGVGWVFLSLSYSLVC